MKIEEIKRHFNGRKSNRRCNKSRLPTPLTFYKQLGVELKGKGDWRMAKCPFHDDQYASLGVSTIHGGFKCHACGESGDMIDFYMTFKQVNFNVACTQLDLWENY